MKFDPSKELTIVVYLDIVNGNPNGDPGTGMPRTNPFTGHGLMSNGCEKRKLRNYFLNEGREIFAMCESAINDTIREEYAKIGVKSTPKDADKANLAKILANKYVDLKFFGHVLATGDLPANNLRGALFVGEGESIHPVIVRTIDISRCYATNDKEKTGKKLNQALGSKSVIDYGMYKFVLKYSSHTGMANGVTSEDLELLVESLQWCWSIDRSANRDLRFQKMVVFSHDPKSVQTQKLEALIEATIAPKPTCTEDVKLVFKSDEVPEGVIALEF
jgi:CRISPR-associated protein Csd2